MSDAIGIWTVYDHPADYPEKFVAAACILDRSCRNALRLELSLKLGPIGRWHLPAPAPDRVDAQIQPRKFFPEVADVNLQGVELRWYLPIAVQRLKGRHAGD